MKQERILKAGVDIWNKWRSNVKTIFPIKLRWANLRGADLRGADLRGADLRWANLRGADLRGADLRGANLSDADLRGADLRGADLRGANLRWANLRGADLRGANLRWANLSDADLRGADLRGANLSDADLRGADLRGADLSDADLRGADLRRAYAPSFQIFPPSGEFVCWKKGENNDIIKLKCPWWARRTSSLVGRKGRLEFAIVLSIEDENGKQKKESTGKNKPGLIYRVGEVVKPDSYDPDIRIECSHGIHVFLTKKEAEEW